MIAYKMKNHLFLILLILFSLTLSGQDDQILPEIEYPFGPPGSEVSRGVFGRDDRKEAKDVEGYEGFVQATAAMIPKSLIKNDRIYGFTLRERLQKKFGSNRFSRNVKFLDQPSIASCSGFLIAPDILITAGHCIKNLEQARQFVWVFDYTNDLPYDPRSKSIPAISRNIYEVKEVLDTRLDKDLKGYDYAVIRLSRKSDRQPYSFRTSGNILEKTPVNTIGSPTGLPLKFSENGRVIDTSPSLWFKSNMDTFPGNSGGPVFDKYGFIEGILVRGAIQYNDGEYTGDFYFDKNCECIRTVGWYSAYLTAGAQVHRITKIPAALVLLALYENIDYSIQNKSMERLQFWNRYQWMYTHDYTIKRGRFEIQSLRIGNMEALDFLLQTTSEKLEDPYVGQMLHEAVDSKNALALGILLENDLYPDAGDASYTPLVKAVENNWLLGTKVLLNYGAQANILLTGDNNLLHLAARNGNKELADLLIDNGVSLRKNNRNRQRPEKVAKKSGFKNLSRYLKKQRKKRR
ncbi:trypsin-like peptidase domain-containing protein [Robiginitalea sp. IMCC44478]|uniref:trypsin-like peptidase domain-containing protein n=1 Tax=Robiginitalea sp. IMCC44478 TaxID=3459122 RepID=UPI004041A8E1